MSKIRFSMLLLEPGEIYFEDYSCSMNTVNLQGTKDAKQGRLKLCSKSLVFEPREWDHPLIKLHFKECTDINTLNSHDARNVIKVSVRQYAEMLEENILAPYKFQYESKDFFFFFDFSSAEECLSQMQQLLRASTLHAPEHNSMIATILHSRYMRMVFDPVMMDDYTEKIICEFQTEKISPLVRHHGKLAVTPTTLYFQPFSNIENSPILKMKLDEMRRIYNRRFLLRQVGLEIYCAEDSPTSHLYLSFQSEHERDRVYQILEESPTVNLERVHIEEMTLQWQNGIVSNYDYLMYLNCLSDRSKNDLTQYPIFPWVVADYVSDSLDFESADTFRDLSRPMGALNQDRLEKLLERYHEMSDPKFLYGSHYSAPGLVLFYLVRKYPQYMLCLQNGRFDHPDRMFNSVKDVYNNCLKNMSDFKELVPEFYDVSAKGDFLVNIYDIDFGMRHDGSKVDNVNLPPWANSPEDFVVKLREALESQYVSRYLHLWIDLIFGYKQRGEEAVKANNVFHHVCYEGSVDLDCIYDMNDRHALEVQIMEFGQVPKQLFTKPHVRKIIPPNTKQLFTKDYENNEYSIECIDTIWLHKEAVNCVLRNDDRIISVCKDGTLKVYDMVQRKQIRSVILSSTPLSCCVLVDEHTVAVGSWDNEIYLYDVEYGRVVESFRAHDDSVTCLKWLPKERLLVSGGWDGVVRVWGSVGKVGQALRGLKAEFDHDGKISSVADRHRRHSLDIIAGTSDGEVFIWDFSTKELINKITVHSSPVNGVCLLSEDRIITVSDNGDLNVTDLTVLNSVYQKRVSPTVTSLCCDGASVLWLGGGAGSLLQWNMTAVAQLSELEAHDGNNNCAHVYQKRVSPTVTSLCCDGASVLWLGGGAGSLLQWNMTAVAQLSELEAHDGNNNCAHVYQKRVSPTVTSLCCDGASVLWLGGGAGSLLQWNMTAVAQLSELEAHDGNNNCAHVYQKRVSPTVTSLCCDGASVLWLGGGAGSLLQRNMTAVAQLSELEAHDGNNNSAHVYQKRVSPTVTSLCCDGASVLWLGGGAGSLLQWNMTAVAQLSELEAHDGNNNCAHVYQKRVSPTVTSLCCDGASVLWLGGGAGSLLQWNMTAVAQLSELEAHDGNNNCAHVYQKRVSPTVTSLCCDGASVLWLGGGAGSLLQWNMTAGAQLSELEAHDGNNNCAHVYQKRVSPTVTSLCCDGDSVLWLGGGAGSLLQWNMTAVAQLSELEAHDGNNNCAHVYQKRVSPTVTSLCCDGDSVLWLGGGAGSLLQWNITAVAQLSELEAHDGNNNCAHVYQKRVSPTVTSLCCDGASVLWLGGGAGSLLQWNMTAVAQLSELEAHDGNNNCAHVYQKRVSPTVTSLCCDGDSVLWLGGGAGSLLQWNMTAVAQLSELEAHDGNNNCAHVYQKRVSPTVTSLCCDGDSVLWLGGGAGSLLQWNMTAVAQLSELEAHDGNNNCAHVYQKRVSPTVTSLCCDGASVLWLGGGAGSLLQWNMTAVAQLSELEAHDGNNNCAHVYQKRVSPTVTSLCCDGASVLWLGGGAGSLLQWNMTAVAQLSELEAHDGNNNCAHVYQKRVSPTVTSLCCDGDSVLWLGGGADSLLQWNMTAVAQLSELEAHDGNNNCAHVYQKRVSPTVTSLCCDGDSVLWLGGGAGSLLQWNMTAVAQLSELEAHDGNNNCAHVYQKRVSPTVTSLCCDGASVLWLGGGAGSLLQWNMTAVAQLSELEAHDGNNNCAHVYQKRVSPTVTSLCCDGDSVLWLGGGADSLLQWNMTAVAQLSELEAHDGNNNCAHVYQKRVSPTVTSLCCDGDSVLWLGGGAGSLLQWNMTAVAQLSELEAHDDLIRSIHFDSTSKTLITASDDKSIKVWQLTRIS